jgi:hypothetical protein
MQVEEARTNDETIGVKYGVLFLGRGAIAQPEDFSVFYHQVGGLIDFLRGVDNAPAPDKQYV